MRPVNIPAGSFGRAKRIPLAGHRGRYNQPPLGATPRGWNDYEG